MIKTYSHINDEIVIPMLKVGMMDLVLVLTLIVGGFFVSVIMYIVNTSLAISTFILFLLSGTVVFFLARYQYVKKNKVNVIGNLFDFYTEDKYAEGRKR